MNPKRILLPLLIAALMILPNIAFAQTSTPTPSPSPTSTSAPDPSTWTAIIDLRDGHSYSDISLSYYHTRDSTGVVGDVSTGDARYDGADVFFTAYYPSHTGGHIYSVDLYATVIGGTGGDSVMHTSLGDKTLLMGFNQYHWYWGVYVDDDVPWFNGYLNFFFQLENTMNNHDHNTQNWYVIKGDGYNPFNPYAATPTPTPTEVPDIPTPECSLDVTSGKMPLTVTVHDDNAQAGTYHWDFSTGEGYQGSHTNTYNLPGTYTVKMEITRSGHTEEATCGSVAVANDYGFNQGGDYALYRPLRARDEDRARNGSGSSAGYVDNATALDYVLLGQPSGYSAILPTMGPYAVTAVSTTAGADVFAIQAGHIASIKDLTDPDCGFALRGLGEHWHLNIRVGDQCLVRIDNVGAEGIYNDGESRNIFIAEMRNVQLVTIENASGGTVQYIVQDARANAREGDTITPGCIIGKTIPIHESSGNIIQATQNLIKDAASGLVGAGTLDKFINQNPAYPTASDHRGVAIVAATVSFSDESVQILPNLSNEITSGHQCNDTRNSSGCVNSDPEFQNIGTAWDEGTGVYQTGVQGNANGVNLSSGGQGWLRSNKIITLEPGTPAHLSVIVAPMNGTGGKLRAKFGDTLQDFTTTVSPTSGQSDVFTVTITPDDANTDYGIYLQNIGTVGLHITKACVSEGEAPGAPAVTGCFGPDPYLDLGGPGWNKSAGAYAAPGQILMGRDSDISMDNVQLYAADVPTNHTGIYDIEVNFELWMNDGSLYPSPDGGGVTNAANITYEWPTGSELAPMTYSISSGAVGIGQTRSSLDADGFAIVNSFPNQTWTIGTEITVTENANSTFTLRPHIQGVSNVKGLKINSICLTGQFQAIGNDSIFPVSPPSGNTGNTPPLGIGPFPEDCQVIPRPTDTGLPSWISWQWYNLKGFLVCDLMVMLNKMYEQVHQFQLTIGWAIRWFMTTINTASKWFGLAIVPWINGHFNNVVSALHVNVNITGDSGGGATLGDVILALINLLGTLLNSIASTLSSILGIVPSILNFLTDLVNIAASLLSTMIIALMTIINQVIGMITSLINFGRIIANSLTVTWNHTAATSIPLMPSCDTDPHSNIVCAVIYLADNTLFSPTTGFGRFFMPIIIGYASIKLILMIINEVRRLIDDIGRQI